MRQVSPAIAHAIESGSFDVEVTLRAFYGNDVTLQDVPVGDWSIESEEGRNVPTSGSVEAVYVDDEGISRTPRDFTDALAPFGQQVSIFVEISADEFTHTLELGYLRINETPEAKDANVEHGSRVLTASSRVKLSLLDGLEGVRANGFTGATGARYKTCWAELAHLSGMRVVRSVDDRALPRVEYELADGGRLKACQAIAAHLGGTLYVRADGALTVLPTGQGPVVRRFKVGEESLVLSEWPRALSTDGLYNEVVGVFEDEDGNEVWVPPAQIVDGPLSVHGPLGHRTKYHSSNLVKTRDEARKVMREVLEQSSTLAAVEVQVEVVLDPRLEIGDIVEFEQDAETLRGRIIKVAHSSSRKTVMTIAVTASFPEPNLGRLHAFL